MAQIVWWLWALSQSSGREKKCPPREMTILLWSAWLDKFKPFKTATTRWTLVRLWGFEALQLFQQSPHDTVKQGCWPQTGSNDRNSAPRYPPVQEIINSNGTTVSCLEKDSSLISLSKIHWSQGWEGPWGNPYSPECCRGGAAVKLLCMKVSSWFWFQEKVKTTGKMSEFSLFTFEDLHQTAANSATFHCAGQGVSLQHMQELCIICPPTAWAPWIVKSIYLPCYC